MSLYHASQLKNLKVLKPQPTLSNNINIGDFVFATSNKSMATMYLVPKGIPTLMNPDDSSKNIVICCTPDYLIDIDQGGAIYELPDENFFETPQQGLSDYEMVSRKEVKPIAKQVYSSSLKALLKEGIVVRFVDEKTFKNLIKNPRQQEIINSIEPYRSNR